MDPRLLVGSTLDYKFEILELAGTGGMGAVYKAKQIELDRIVAIKLLHISLAQDEELRSRFEREAQALSSLKHANIGTFYSYGIWKDSPYIAMEYLQGKSLKQMLQERDTLPWEQALRIMQQVCDAMHCAHQTNFIHRDLSTNNIILLNESGADIVKIIDFGLAKTLAPTRDEIQKLTQTGELLGSVHYMSPELCSGKKVDHRSDIYSCACILYECITGEVPFTADNPIGILHKHAHEKAAPLTEKVKGELPKGLEELLCKGMAKDPNERYQSMAEMKNDLTLVLSGMGVDSSSYKEFTKAEERLRTTKSTTLKLGIAALLIAAIGIFAALNTEAGLNSIAKGLLFGKLDANRTELLLQVLSRLEDMKAETSAKELRQQLFDSLARQHALRRQLRICVAFAERLRAKGDNKEAENWAWQGLRQVSTLAADAHSSEEEIQIVNKLVQLCLDFHSRATRSRLDTLRLIYKPQDKLKYSNKELLRPVCKLNDYLLQSLPPSMELLEQTQHLLLLESKLKAYDAAMENLRRALVLCDKESVSNGRRLNLLSSAAFCMANTGNKEEARKLIDRSLDMIARDKELQVEVNSLLDCANASYLCDRYKFPEIQQRLDYVAGEIPSTEQGIYWFHDMSWLFDKIGDYKQNKRILDTMLAKMDKLGHGTDNLLSATATVCFSTGMKTQQYGGLEPCAAKLVQRFTNDNEQALAFEWNLHRLELCIYQKEFAKAEALTREMKAENTEQMLRVGEIKMTCAQFRQDEKEADRIYREYSDIAEKAGKLDDFYFNTMLHRYCVIKRKKGDFTEDRNIARKQVDGLARQNKNSVEYLKWRWYFVQLRPSAAEYYNPAKEMKALLKECEKYSVEPNQMAEYWRTYGDNLDWHNNFDERVQAYEKSMSVAESLSHKTYANATLLSHHLHEADKHEKELKEYERQLRIKIKQLNPAIPDERSGLFLAKSALSDLAIHRKDRAALDALTGELRALLYEDDIQGLAQFYFDSGMRVFYMRDQKEAERFMRKSLELPRDKVRAITRLRAQEYLFLVLGRQGHYPETREVFFNELQESKDKLGPEEYKELLLSLAQISAENKDTDNAKRYLEMVFKVGVPRHGERVKWAVNALRSANCNGEADRLESEGKLVRQRENAKQREKEKENLKK